MKANGRIFWVVCVAALVLGPWLAMEAGAAEESGQGGYRWKIATLAPKDLGFSKYAQEAIYPRIEAACNGAVKVKVYWGGVMGDDEQYLSKIRIGQLQGAALSSQGSIMACPEFSVVELPFLFKNYNEVDYVRNKMFSTFEFLFKQYGFKLLSWIDQDFDQVFSRDFPIATVEDFAKARFATAHGRMEDVMLKALGAQTIHMEVPEAPASIRSGVVNAGIAPVMWVVGAQLFTSYKYMTDLKMRYSPAVTVIAWKSWTDIPKKCQAALYAENEIGTRKLNDMIHLNNFKFMKSVIEYGMVNVNVSPENLSRIKKKAMSIYPRLAGDMFPVELLQEINQYLADFRSGKGEASKSYAQAPDEADIPHLEVKAGTAGPAEAKAKRGWWEERKKQIVEIQKKLASLGFYPGAIDGITGPLTAAGIEKYQKTKGLDATGKVDQDLLDSMGIK